MATITERLEAGTAALEAAAEKFTQYLDALAALPMLAVDHTIYVSPTGVPEPANPLGGDPFDTITRAAEWLQAYRVAPSAKVTISVAPGTYNHTTPIPGHIDGAAIQIIGADLAGDFPLTADFTKSGTTAANHEADAATNEAMLRSRFSVIVNVTGSAGVGCNKTAIGRIQNILFVGDATAGADGISVSVDGSVSLVNVSLHRFDTGLQSSRNSTINSLAGTTTVSNCVGHGVSAADAGYIRLLGAAIIGNDANGVTVSDGSTAVLDGTDSLYNTQTGASALAGSSVFARDGAQLRYNGENGLSVARGSLGIVTDAVVSSNTALSLFANDCSNIVTNANTVGVSSASPAVNTLGNANSYIAN